jgi:hypothetical protein
MAETKSNSRFFTNCYHQAAAIEPAASLKRERVGKYPHPWRAGKWLRGARREPRRIAQIETIISIISKR